MSQSPIRLQSIDNKTRAIDAIPLIQPHRLFECQYKLGKVNGCFEGEPRHANFVVQGSGPIVRFRGVSYELKKIHIHSESEHVVERDDPCDFELHLVHAPLGSPIASPLVVVGILFTVSGQPGKPNKSALAISEMIKSAESHVCVALDPLDLFPRSAKGKPDTTEWFHYEGSLTGFPYSENVSWIVMRNPATVSENLIESLSRHAEQHSRELQPLDRRIVVRSFLDKSETR